LLGHAADLLLELLLLLQAGRLRSGRYRGQRYAGQEPSDDLPGDRLGAMPTLCLGAMPTLAWAFPTADALRLGMPPNDWRVQRASKHAHASVGMAPSKHAHASVGMAPAC
jgi:hypothetical protein